MNLAADAAVATWNTATTIDATANDTVSAGTLSLQSVTAPAHGTATIDNGKIVYTPASGYYGTDSFNYTVRAEQGGATASTSVSVAVEAVVRVSGVASDAPLPAATITADVAGRVFTGTADANGAFDLVLRSANPADFVRLDAQSSTASHVRLRSLVGEMGALVTAAGTAGQVSSASIAQLNISHHSTSAAALAFAANGGALPATAAQLNAALARVSSADSDDMSALIQRVVDGGVALPSGKADLWSLLTDTAAYQSFLSATVAANLAAYNAALQAVVASRPGTAPPTRDELSGHTFVYFGKAAAPDNAYVVTYHANGNAQIRDEYGTSLGTWSRDDQRIVVTITQPATSTTYSDDIDPVTGEQNLVTVERKRLVLTRMASPAAAYAIGAETRQTYADGSRQGQTVTLTSADQPGTVHGALDLAERLPIAGTEFGNGKAWAGVAKEMGESLGTLQDVVLVNGGGQAASLTDFSRSYQLSIADNTLSVAPLTNGVAMIATQYMRLQVDADGGERWLALAPIVAGGASGNGRALSLPFVPVAASAIDPMTMAGHAWQSFKSATSSVVHQIFSDGSGRRIAVLDGAAPATTSITWLPNTALALPVLEMRNATGNTNRVRTWAVLQRSGSTTWVLEANESRAVSESPLVFWSRVIRLQDLGALTP